MTVLKNKKNMSTTICKTQLSQMQMYNFAGYNDSKIEMKTKDCHKWEVVISNEGFSWNEESTDEEQKNSSAWVCCWHFQCF